VVLPLAPGSVRLVFNEPVDLVGRGVRVVGPDGRRAEREPVRVSGSTVSVGVAATEPGTYLVIWRVVAKDTHPAQGTFAFSVGHPSSPPGGPAAVGGSRESQGLVLQMLARALHFTGYALGFGLLAFRQTVLVPLALATDPLVEQRIWRLIGAGVITLLIAEPVALLAQAASLSVGGSGPLDLEVIGGALDSSFGRVLAQRLGAAVLFWVLIGAARNARANDTRTTRAALLLGVVVAFIDGEAAHAIGTRPSWLGLGVNTLHEAALGTWVGGVLGVLAVWWAPGVAGYRSPIASRAARIAAVSVILLLASGTVMALQHLTGLRDLFTTAYGRTLLAKLCVIAAVLLLAFAAARAPADRRSLWWTAEAALLLSVLALAGLLVSLPPPV
jgi:copper transport protein